MWVDGDERMTSPIRIRLARSRWLTVTLEQGTVVLAARDGWSQRLTRAQAWALAEALDAVATAPEPEGRPTPGA